ncbi:MAG: hypothetical protein U1C96_10900 [Gallionella sp.]|nr:hypothetical protein [Gallionella sp.]
MGFHPATQILIWCVLIALMQQLALQPLLFAAGSVLFFALLISRHKLFQLLSRTRWILLSLLLIYGYSTPGQAVLESLGELGPTREGLIDGALQLTRLLAALAGLAILLDRLHRLQLIAGLYVLFAPLQYLGVSRERIAVRLALTLHYAEVTMLRGKTGWRDTLDGLFQPHGESTREIELPRHHFSWRDGGLLAAAFLLLWWAVR